MATQTDIPSDLTDDDKASIFQLLDSLLNSLILLAVLHGIYTGILAVTLWNIFINKCWPIRRAMVAVIILLHSLVTINVAVNWSYRCSAFIENGQSFWTVYLRLTSAAQTTSWETSIAASMSVVLADSYIIWYCWMIWGRRRVVVVLPIFFLISATVSKIIQVYRDYFDPLVSDAVFTVLYISFTLATTLWCTLLIIYRILAVAGVRRGAEGRLRVYRRFIEVLVESSALYSISLILYLAFTLRDSWGEVYLDVIASIMKGTAPTLLVGRFTVGHHARPNGSWQGSVIASASIRSQDQERSRTSSQEDRPTSLALEGDLEAQRESVVREPSPAFFPRPSARPQGVMTMPEFEDIELHDLGHTEGSNRVSVESLRLGR